MKSAMLMSFLTVLAVSALGGAASIPEQQHDMESNLERQNSYSTCRTYSWCEVRGGKCQPLEDKCDGDLMTGSRYCRGSTCGCCVPRGCELDGTVYQNGSKAENRCIYLQCINGKWEWYDKSSRFNAWNPDCNHCYTTGDTDINMRELHNIDEVLFKQYHFNGTPGTYSFSQAGLKKPTELIMEAGFEYINEYHNETHITSVTYRELGIEVKLIFPSPDDYNFCNGDPTNSLCEAQVLVNGHNVALKRDYNSVASFHGLIGTVFIINRGKNWPFPNAWGSLYIVGSQGMSVRFDYGGWHPVYVVSMAMPSLKTNTFGLCDVWTDLRPTGFTMSNGDATTDTDEFVQSWKLSDLVASCTCSFRLFIGIPPADGCVITKAAPAGTACRCELGGDDNCSGFVVACKDGSSEYCLNPGTDKPSCEQGQGNCGGYPMIPITIPIPQ